MQPDEQTDQTINEVDEILNASTHDSVLPLEEDGDRPFSEPDDVSNDLDPTHQATDANIDETEQYHEGAASAAEASEPNNGGIVGYTPPTTEQDDRSQV